MALILGGAHSGVGKSTLANIITAALRYGRRLPLGQCCLWKVQSIKQPACVCVPKTCRLQGSSVRSYAIGPGKIYVHSYTSFKLLAASCSSCREAYLCLCHTIAGLSCSPSALSQGPAGHLMDAATALDGWLLAQDATCAVFHSM